MFCTTIRYMIAGPIICQLMLERERERERERKEERDSFSYVSSESTAGFWHQHSPTTMLVLLLLFLLFLLTSALSASEWRAQSIYQVVTDRFARTDGSTTVPCDVVVADYCGGTWRGLIDRLDYIQGMGFTAVWISPVVKQIGGNTRDGCVFFFFFSSFFFPSLLFYQPTYFTFSFVFH